MNQWIQTISIWPEFEIINSNIKAELIELNLIKKLKVMTKNWTRSIQSKFIYE